MNFGSLLLGILLGAVVGAGAIWVEKVKPDAAAAEAMSADLAQAKDDAAAAQGSLQAAKAETGSSVAREKKLAASLAKALDEAKKLREEQGRLKEMLDAALSKPEASAPKDTASAPADGGADAAAAATAKSGEMMKSVVLVKGDNSQGTGFLVKTETGPCVVTNLHVLFNNPNCQITTASGAKIKLGVLRGASDRDLALISIQDDGYGFADLSKDVAKEAKLGDAIVTPGNSDGGEVILPTNGKLLAIGSDRVEFDNPIFHGNSGGPVFDNTANKVIGVVTQAMKVEGESDLNKASLGSQNSAIKGTMRYFGFRLDTVPKWEEYDWSAFLAETAEIDSFHKRSMALHSYLNGDKKNPSQGPDPDYYQTDEALRNAQVEFRAKISRSNSEATRTHAVEDLLVVLRNVADMNVDTLRQRRFYAFDQARMADELKFRDALRKEIDNITFTFDRE